jgi:hypothetical protein
MIKRETTIKMGTTGYERFHTGKEDHGKKLRRRSCGKTERDGEAWLSYDPPKVETSWKKW